MAKKIKFTNEEIENAIHIFNELSISFAKDNEIYLAFKSRPISFLRKSGVSIMKYINNENQKYFLNRFSVSIRNILRFKDFFDSCSWCKVSSLTIIYALCGKARLSIDTCWGILSSIIEAMENILNLSNELARSILKRLNSLNQGFSPFHLAMLICEHLGYCPCRN
jgi:hypothetical protein